MGFGILMPPRRGFDARLGMRTVAVPRSGIVSVLRVIAVGTVLGLGLMVAAAGPAYADGKTILSTKSIPAPLGARDICQRYAWACSTSSQGAVTGSRAKLELANRVNLSVNRSVREITDERQYRRREHWALPTQRGGDCEDFALLKKRELIRAGIAPSQLLIATVLDRRREAHAVLVLRTAAGDYVLDNLTNRIKPWDRTGYSFLRMQDPQSASGWTLVMRGGIFG